MKVGMISLGCTKNLVDSETALGLFKDAGYVFTGDPAEADVLMVNTCGFIGPAKEESIDTILEMAQYKQTGNCKLLVVTGCLAQRYEKALMEEIPEIDLLMGVNQYDQLVGAVDAAMKDHKRRSLCGVKNTFLEHDRVLTTPGYTAYIRIGDGCSNRCTYCAIPLIRGNYRSRPMADVMSEVRRFAAAGREGAYHDCAGHHALRHGLAGEVPAARADGTGGGGARRGVAPRAVRLSR